MTPLPDLLRSFLSSKPRWNASDTILARKILSRLCPTTFLDQLKQDPALIMELAGLRPDPWQKQLLRSQSTRSLLLCSRQAGKSTATAALTLRVALFESPALILLLSPTARQSGELFHDKVLRLLNALGRPVRVVQESALSLALANGSRILSLPGTEGTIRGYSGVTLLVIDEAARVDDDLYYAIRPMLAVSGGRLVVLSTPWGKRGWFYEEWAGSNPWERVKITAAQCPRIAPSFLAEEERVLGERWFKQEYLCEFADVVDAVFSNSDLQAALAYDVKPLFAEGLR